MDIGVKFIQLCERIIEWLRTPMCYPKRKRNSRLESNLEEELHLLASQNHNADLQVKSQLIESDNQKPNQQTISMCILDNLSLAQIVGFLSVKEIEMMKQINRKFYNLIEKDDAFQNYYASTKYGHFFKPRYVKSAIKALNLFYYAWCRMKLASTDEAGYMQANLALFQISFNQFENLFEKQNCEWASLYLAIMLYKGYGAEKNSSQLRKYVEVLKNMWPKMPDEASFKNNESIEVLSKLILENYYQTQRQDPSDKQFYDQYLSVLRMNSTK